MPHCRVQSPGEISHDRATLQGVIIPSAILEIVFSPYLFFFVFFNAVWALTSGGFRIVSDTLVLTQCRSSIKTRETLHILIFVELFFFHNIGEYTIINFARVSLCMKFVVCC